MRLHRPVYAFAEEYLAIKNKMKKAVKQTFNRLSFFSVKSAEFKKLFLYILLYKRRCSIIILSFTQWLFFASDKVKMMKRPNAILR